MSERQYPSDWELRPLQEVAGTITSGGTPRSGDPRYYTAYGGHPFAKIEDLTSAKGHDLAVCELHITNAALNESAAKLYPKGTILLSMYGTIGLVKRTTVEMAANQALSALLPPFESDADYLVHHLDYIRPEWTKHSGQTTQANINGKVVKNRLVPLPPLLEQQKIAQVLDTLDTQIRQTEALIAKLERIKQGLLTDLLTRGIDQNGQLRPTPDQAPHLYKDSPLGRIPREWEVSVTGEVCYSIVPGRNKPVLDGGEFPWVTVTDLTENRVFQSRLGLSVSSTSLKNAAGRTIPAGSVIMSCVGEFGTVSVAGCELVINQQLHAFVPDPQVEPDWLMHVLRIQGPLMDRMATQTTIKYLNKKGCESIPIVVSPPDEQVRVLDTVRQHESQNRHAKEEVRKLRLAKQGLMDDLLTGRVRVTPLLNTTEQAYGKANKWQA